VIQAVKKRELWLPNARREFVHCPKHPWQRVPVDSRRYIEKWGTAECCCVEEEPTVDPCQECPDIYGTFSITISGVPSGPGAGEYPFCWCQYINKVDLLRVITNCYSDNWDWYTSVGCGWYYCRVYLGMSVHTLPNGHNIWWIRLYIYWDDAVLVQTAEWYINDSLGCPSIKFDGPYDPDLEWSNTTHCNCDFSNIQIDLEKVA